MNGPVLPLAPGFSPVAYPDLADWGADKVAKYFSISVAQVYLAKHRVTEAIKNEVKRLQAEIV